MAQTTTLLGPQSTGWDRARQKGAGTWSLEGTAKQLLDKHVAFFQSEPTPVPTHYLLRNQRNWGINKLQKVFVASHASETAFDKELFAQLKTLFPTRNDIDANQFTIYETAAHALGFSRQVSKGDLHIDPEWGGTRNNRYGHCLVLFKKENGTNTWTWKVSGVLRVVELKMNNTAAKFFPITAGGLIQRPELATSAEAIGQAVTYNFDVWLCMRRLALHVDPLLQVPKAPNDSGQVPFCIISGFRTRRDRHGRITLRNALLEERTQCLVGHTVVPGQVGGQFGYTVRYWSFFENKRKKRNASARTTALAYADHLFSAIPYGRNVVNSLQGVANLPPSRPLSGCNDLFPGCVYIGSADPQANIEAPNRVSTSQGDLWSLSVDSGEFDGLLDGARLQRYRKTFAENLADRLPNFGTKDRHVVIKVSAPAVHSRLLSLLDSEDFLEKTESIAPIRNLVLGVSWMPHSSITIMRDLSQEGYRVMRLDYFATTARLPSLWDGFVEFTTNCMIPLAKKDLFHFDLRVDDHETANLLVLASQRRRRDGNPKLHLCPVDLESISHQPPTTQDARYSLFPLPEIARKKLNLVYWQVMLAGYGWTNLPDERITDSERLLWIIIGDANSIRTWDASEGDVLALLSEIGTYIEKRAADGTTAPGGVKPFQDIHEGIVTRPRKTSWW